jgi:hypothetical protein
MPQIKALFSQFLYSEVLNISDSYNNEIKNEILKILNNKEKNIQEFVTDYHDKLSPSEILCNPTFTPLFSVIRENIVQFFNEININRSVSFRNIWLSVTYPGQYHDFHNHGDIVYCQGYTMYKYQNL